MRLHANVSTIEPHDEEVTTPGPMPAAEAGRVGRGEINPARYETYVRLASDLGASR